MISNNNDLLKATKNVNRESDLELEQTNLSPCVSPPTCASPTSLKPTLIEDDDDQFLCPSTTGIQSNISVSGMPGTNNDIPVDKENPMRCVECGEEFVNHFRCVEISKKNFDINYNCKFIVTAYLIQMFTCFFFSFQLKTTLSK